MDTQIDWREELDSSFGHGPDGTVADYLGEGHRAVRRRRAAVSVAGLAAAVVVGGVVWSLAPGDAARSDGVPVATQPPALDPTSIPTSSPTSATAEPMSSPTVAALPTVPADVSTATAAQRDEVAGPVPATAMADGSLVVQRGWVVESVEVAARRTRDGVDEMRQWGLVVSPEASPDEDTWVLVTWRLDCCISASSDPAGKSTADLDTWIARMQALERGDVPPSLAHTEGGRFVADTDLEVIEAVAHPEQAAAYGPVAEAVAAKVRLADGTVLFVLARAEDSLTVEPAVLDAPTMAAFLRHLAAQAESGEGVR